VKKSKDKAYNRIDATEVSRLYSEKQNPHDIIAAELGRDFNDYREKWEKGVNFECELPFPLHIDFEIGYQCNYRCKMCVMSLPPAQRNLFGDPSKRLSFETFRKIVDEGSKHGLKSIGLNGLNEPLLRDDICDWVRYARNNGIVDVMFNTNGMLLNERNSRDLIEARLTRIMISIDAAKDQTYSEIRQQDSLRQVKANVERFVEIRKSLERRLPIVRVSFVKMKRNLAELDEFIEYWKDKVDFFSIQRFGNPLLKGEPNYEVFDEQHIEEPSSDFKFKCPQPWVRLLVGHNGDVNPCCGIQGPRLVVGNIYKDSIKEIWRNNTMAYLRKIHKAGRYRDFKICHLCCQSLYYE